MFISTVDIHLQHQIRMSREEALAEAVKWVRYGRQQLGRDAELEFSAMDATRSDPDYLLRVVEAVVEAGATTVNLPDTVGYAMPTSSATLIKRGRGPASARVPSSASTATTTWVSPSANTLAAMQAGARQVEVTINGIGERAGNAALEEVVMALAHAPGVLRGAQHGRRHRADRARQPPRQLPHRASPSSPTRPSSAATPSRTSRASTRTACSRTRSPTRS